MDDIHLREDNGDLRNSSSSEEDEHIPIVLQCAVTVSILIIYMMRQDKMKRTRSLFPARKETIEEITAVYSDSDFRNAFRMGRQAFDKLFEVLSGSSCIGERAENDTRSIPGRVRVAIGLRVMAGASVHDLMLAYKVSKTSVHRCFKQFITAVVETMELPGIPEDPTELEKLSLGFKKSRKKANPLSGCIGALDGICVRIKKPRWYENPASFFSRKGFYSIPVQALVDYKYRFMDMSALAVGSTNDALAFAMSPLAKFLEAGKLVLGYFVAADNAYALSPSLVCPFPGKELPLYQSATNYFLSSMRVHVEQAFGILKRRWRVCYNGELSYSVDDCVPIIAAGMMLHNFCIDTEGILEYIYEDDEVEELKKESKKWHEVVQKTVGTAENDSTTLGSGFIRNLLLDIVTKAGLLRPTYKL